MKKFRLSTVLLAFLVGGSTLAMIKLNQASTYVSGMIALICFLIKFKKDYQSD